MKAERFEVAVVGLGGVGSAAFHSLAMRGVRVVGIDRFGSIHEHGSSHGQSRIFRIAYFEHHNYVPLASYSRNRWIELDQRSDKRVFMPLGGAWIGPESGVHVRESKLAADLHGLEYELLDPGEAMRRWPALRIPRDQVCFHEPDAGMICPEHAVEAFLGEGAAHGGRIMRGDPVDRLEPDDLGVSLRVGDRWLQADRVILAMGPWMESQLRDAGVHLEPQRQLQGWTRPSDPELVAEGRLPVWLFADNDESIQYGFPICGGLPGPEGVKVARHCAGERCDPDSVNREIDPEDEQVVLEGLEDRIPAAFGPLHAAKTCLYTMSSDGHFILDRHPSNDRITIACGFSGHGFKFCPALGEALADLALEGGSQHPVDFLGLARLNRPEDEGTGRSA